MRAICAAAGRGAALVAAVYRFEALTGLSLPTMVPAHHPTLAFVTAARALAVRRVLALAAADLALGLSSLALLGAATAALTLRGDLVLPILAAATLALVVTVALRVRAHLRGPLRSLRSTARLVSRTPGLVGPPVPRADAEARQQARRLRQDLLGAIELLSAMQQPDDGTATEDSVTRVGSSALAHRFADEVGYRLARARATPRDALPAPRIRARLFAAAALVAVAVPTSLMSGFETGVQLLWSSRDGRPPTPPSPIWSSLELTMTYPAHTGRPQRVVPNPSGVLRLPAGTSVMLDMRMADDAEAVEVVVLHDGGGDGNTPAPERLRLTAADDPASAGERRFRGSFVARGSGLWSAIALDDADDDADAADARRSAAMPLALEADAPPEVELPPLPADQVIAGDVDTVSLRFSARDDFGLLTGTLVYLLPDGELRRLPIDDLPRDARDWRGRYRWDLASIPVESRAEVVYWIEVRDNDPGLGWTPLPDAPGKVSASARQRLLVHDEEAEHAQNLVGLRELRDFAVDLLAMRLTSRVFRPTGQGEEVADRLADLRALHGASEALLIGIAAMIDHLATDAKVRERDVRVLAEIHARLLELNRREARLHEALPEGAELTRPSAVAPFLARLTRHNTLEVTQLEDEIIRLDDLVDGQIIESLESLTARLQASQQKLVGLLEQLRAGDESVRPQIEQLQERIQEDVRRISEARRQLQEEVGEEYMNLDAFAAMEARARNLALLEQLRRGEIDQALEQARGALDETRRMRDAIQQRAGAEGGETRLSPEDEARMKLLRELGRLDDEQTSLSGEVARVHERWRSAVAGIEPADLDAATRSARAMREDLDAINDARLSRDGREAYHDLRAALARFEAKEGEEQRGSSPPSSAATPSGATRASGALELFEAADEAARALDDAIRGAAADEAEARRLRALRGPLSRLRASLAAPLPDPAAVLDDPTRAQVASAAERQAALRQRVAEVIDSEDAKILPEAGTKALEDAQGAMAEADTRLRALHPREALERERSASQAIERAIDSLRRGDAAPPSRRGGGEASTDAEQDRSLRDQVIDAMREGERVDEPTTRYYEALLR